MSTLHPTELERRAEEHYRRVYGTSPDQAAITDHGNPVLREHLLTEMRERMANARLEVQARHRRESERDRERAAEQAARDTAAADDREAELRRRFDTRFPGGSDADFQALRPTLMAELSREAAQSERDAYAIARARIRF